MKLVGEFSKNFFPFSCFPSPCHRGRIADAAHLPHLPSPARARRKPFVATTASRRPPRLSSSRGSSPPTAGVSRPVLGVSATCSRRRILGALLLPPPPNPAALAAAGGERGLLRELAPPPSRCVVTEGIFPFLLRLPKDRSRSCSAPFWDLDR